MAVTKYRRLPGRGVRHRGSRCTLWAGPDHLLSLDQTIGSESYRRFYYRDIEAMIIRRTMSGRGWNIALFSLAVLCGGAFLVSWFNSRNDSSLLIAGLITSGFFLLILLINSLLGPTCKTHVRTAVQLEELPSLNRLRNAIKAVSQIKTLVEEAQGPVSPEKLSTQWAGLSTHNPAAAFPISAPPVLRSESGKAHLWLFGCFFVSALITSYELFHATTWLTATNLIVTLGTVCLLIIALKRQMESNLPQSIKILTWSILGYDILAVVAYIVFTIIYSIRHVGVAPENDPFFIRSEPGFLQVAATFGVFAFALSLSGLILLFIRKKIAVPPPFSETELRGAPNFPSERPTGDSEYQPRDFGPTGGPS